MPRRGTSKNDKPSSNARTSSQTASPAPQALVQRLSKLHYGYIEDSGVQYLQRMANKLHNHSRVPLRSSIVKSWKEDLDCGTILYHVNALAPTISTQLTRLFQYLGDNTVNDPKHSKRDVYKHARRLALHIATILAVNALVHDLLPLVDSWACFDTTVPGPRDGSTVYLDALMAVLAKHQVLLDKLDKVDPFAKVKAAFGTSTDAVLATKGGLAHDKNTAALAKLQMQLQETIRAYDEQRLRYLSQVKTSRGRRPYLQMIPSDLRASSSVNSGSTAARSTERWPREFRSRRRQGRRDSSQTGSSLFSAPIDSDSSSDASDLDGRRAESFQTVGRRPGPSETDNPPVPYYYPLIPSPPPSLRPPPGQFARDPGVRTTPRPPASPPAEVLPNPPAMEGWRRTVAANTPVPPGNVPPVASIMIPPPPMLRSQSPAQTIIHPQPSPPSPLRPPMVLPPPLHPPMVFPPPPPTPPSDERRAVPFPGPVLPGPVLVASSSASPARRRSASSRSSRSIGSDSSGGHWNPTMRNWSLPPSQEPEIRWPDLPQALTDACNKLQAKDSEFRKAQARYAQMVRRRDADLRKARAFDQLPKACCELLLFLQNNFDLHKTRSVQERVLR